MIPRRFSADDIPLTRLDPESLPKPTKGLDVVDTLDLQALIEQRQVAALARFRPDHPEKVARLCLEQAEAHPDEVSVLLWNKAVAREAKALLRDEARGASPEEARTVGVALARAILNAGHPLPGPTEDWPAGVRELLEGRSQARSDYWASKSDKFRKHQYKNGKRIFPAPGAPFFSRNPGRTLACLNGVLGKAGKKFTCRHLVWAVKDEPKAFLRRISQRDVSFLDHDQLENHGRAAAQRVRGQSSVQFTPENFGKLLVRVASLVPPGESRSFAVYYQSGMEDSRGHDMRLFLKKAFKTSEGVVPGHPMGLKVSLYDPNVTGDMSHLRELPENLERLCFNDFDTEGTCAFSEAQVLSLELGDPALARAWAGQFIPAGQPGLQMSSFLNALATGNLQEMQSAAARLRAGKNGFSNLNHRLVALLGALDYALQDGHAEAVRMLCEPALLEALEPKVLEVIARMKHGLVPCLHQLLLWGEGESVAVFGELLAQMAPRLEAAVIEDAIRAQNGRTPGLYIAMERGHAEAIKAYGRVVLRFKERLGAQTVLNLLLARSGASDNPGLSQALVFNHGAAVAAYGEVLLASGLPSSSLLHILLTEGSGPRTGFGRAVHWGEQKAVRAYAELVIKLQTSEARLRGPDALALWHMVRRSCQKRAWYFPCVWVYRDPYRALVRHEPDLHALIQRAQGLLLKR